MRLVRSWLAVLGLLVAGGCGGPRSLVTVVGPGVVNDPRNKSLRFDIFEFGVQQLCDEMRQRGIPLRLRDDEPVLGRFFADTCSAQPIDEDHRKTLVVQYSGRGYAWTAQTRRVGFTSQGVIEYAPDFQVHEGAMYVYFRPRTINALGFETQLCESGLASTVITALQVPVNDVGQHVVKSQLERGFTVIRLDRRGEVDFGLGYVPLGQRPFRPFQVERSRKLPLENARTEVHTGQQDFVGGFAIEGKRQALDLHLTVDGSPALDLFILPKAYADQMLGAYTTQPGPAALPAPPVFEDQVVAGQPYHRTIPLPPGLYLLVLDNSAQVGRTAPPTQLADDRAARVDYLVLRGKAP